MPSFRTPPPIRLGMPPVSPVWLVGPFNNCSRIAGQCLVSGSRRVRSTVIRSTPALPLLPLTCPQNASFKFARSHTSSRLTRVGWGVRAQLINEGESIVFPSRLRASPVGTDEKASSKWMFSSLSAFGLGSYLLSLVRAFSHLFPARPICLTPTFGTEWPH